MSEVLNKVMSLMGKDHEHDSDKGMLLKQLLKEISQNKYAKFYRPRQGEVDISLGQYFYSLYKAICPLQVFLNDPAKETRIRQITLEAFLDKQVMDLIKRLSPDVIAERKKTAGDDISDQLRADLAALAAGFDNPRIAAADKCYNLIASVKRFVFFDFCAFLEKFDPEMKEGDFVSHPKFSPVDASILVSEISTFLSILPSFNDNDDWKTVFEILKYCRGGTDVIPLTQWTNVLNSLKDVKNSKILELISKVTTGNPILEIKSTVPNEGLSALWLEQKTLEVREVITGIAGSQRQAQINNLAQAVFGSLATIRLSYYTPERGKILIDKYLETYVYASGLNFLITFIQEFISKEVQELCDILLVRGQWTKNAASRQMSDSYHDILSITAEITELDESLSEDGSNGPRLKGSLLRVDRDKSQARYINSIINGINEEALNIINRAVPPLIVLGKHFKLLFEDHNKKPFELIMNWKELVLMSKVPIAQRIAAVYKKINYFVQLMYAETRQIEE